MGTGEDRPTGAAGSREPGAGPAARAHFDAVFSAAYEELHRLAGLVRSRERAQTLNTTALVNEAWLKLAGSPQIAETSPLHFRRIAARAMRQVLVDAARRRRADKRGGPAAVHVTFDETIAAEPDWIADVLGLDAALSTLAALEPRQARMVEFRFFGGLEVAEIAQLLDVSEATVLRDWRAARAWLAATLARGD